MNHTDEQIEEKLDNMKISFKIEVEGCAAKDKARCPFLQLHYYPHRCEKVSGRRNAATVAYDNATQLTKTCPMVRAQFEALE